MRSGAACFAGVFVVLTAVVASAEVDDYLGRPVASIRLTSEGHDTRDPRLLQIVQTRIGRPLTMIDVRQTMVHLFSLGRFQDVRVRADVTPGGLALIYELMPAYPVERVQFIGSLEAPGVDEGRLRRAVVDRYGPSPPSVRAPDVARLLEEQLRDLGYLRAAVVPRVELRHSPDLAVLTFKIDAGARTRIGAIRIVGSPGISEKDLLDGLDLSTGAPYERGALNARIAQYLENRRKRGYFEARLVPAVQLADEDRVANLTLTAAEGPHVRVVFKGDPLPADRRDQLVPISREGSADEDLLEDASNAIADYLHAQGYRDATAPHARELSDGELLITFTITRGPRYTVADVEISGNTSIPLADFQPRLRLRRGQPFASALLDADLSAIEDVYRRRGFASARAQAVFEPAPGSPPAPSPVLVVVRIQITENVQTTVASVRVVGNSSVPEPAVRDGLALQPGRPFLLAQLALDRDAIQLQYANLGYPSATVDSNPGLSPDQRRASVVFTVHEGPRIFVEHVIITGNTRTSTQTIERQLQLKSGDPLGLSALTESQRRLSALGFFRRARITELSHGEETMRDLLVTVEEAPATTVGYGGGLEVGQFLVSDAGVASQRIEVEPAGFFEIGRRNLFGSNRSVNLFTSLSLRPNGTLPNQPAGTVGANQYRVLGTFRDPRVFGTAADASLTGTFEQQIRATFNFARRAFSAAIARRVSRTLSLSGNYQIQRVELLNEIPNVAPQDQLRIDQSFPQVRLSSFSLSAIHDNHDALNPRDGHYLSANAQLAARDIGSEVGFVKSYLTAELFRLLPRTHATVFGASARLGMAAGFPQAGTPVVPPDQPNLPASERFFAGGDTTVRGFAFDQLGSPATTKGGFPVGGDAVVILNAELRMPVYGAFGVVGFVDTGNVFARTTDINVGQLRTAIGFGVRYRSPVGPIRVDLGFKVHREEIAPGILEAPSALHISLGQAF